MEDEKNLEEITPEIRLAEETDGPSILELQRVNLAENVSEEKKKTRGFVSVRCTPELLNKIILQEKITVATVGEKLAGYLMPMTVEHAATIPLLDPFLEKVRILQFEGKQIHEYRYCIIGQVCVDEEFSGKGIAGKLYAELKTRLASQYDLGISEVGSNNPNSLHVHLDKIGLQDVETYSADGRDWHIVILDFRK